ncbi:MAG: hypothetical protein J7L31_02970 [Thermoplasmata archaeon]|nr:hypothetical protein [Thermoplasmata archaeon]
MESIIEARCYDGIDYSSIASIKINVKNEGKEKELPVLTIAAVAIIAAITLIAVALRMRKR